MRNEARKPGASRCKFLRRAAAAGAATAFLGFRTVDPSGPSSKAVFRSSRWYSPRWYWYTSFPISCHGFQG